MTISYYDCSSNNQYRREVIALARDKTTPSGGKSKRDSLDPDFFQKIGQKGGKTTSRLHGPSFYSEIGKKGGQRVRQLVNEGKKKEK